MNDFLWLTFVGMGTFPVSSILDGNIDRIEGTAFDDIITGNQNANEFIGLSGDDLLCGEAVFDVLDVICDDGSLGTAGGNDVLWGGDGCDIGRGGRGTDFFMGVNDPVQEADTVKAQRINLIDASDTGVSQTDNLTNDTSPTFDVIAVPGTFVELYRSTMPGGFGSVVASAMFSERGLSQLPDNSSPAAGTYYYYITVADDPTALKSQPSDQLAVTIDTAGPQVTGVAIAGTNTFDVPYSIPTGSGALQLKTVPQGGADQLALRFAEPTIVADSGPAPESRRPESKRSLNRVPMDGGLPRRTGEKTLDLGGRFGTNERYTPSISGVMAR